MKIGCGTDIIEISRIKESIEKFGDTFLKKVFTDSEIEYCEKKNSVKYQHYAARFAAKEAIYKAINSFDERIKSDFLDAEVISSVSGKPRARFLNSLEYLNKYNTDLSLSHCKEYSVAVFVINKENFDEIV